MFTSFNENLSEAQNVIIIWNFVNLTVNCILAFVEANHLYLFVSYLKNGHIACDSRVPITVSACLANENTVENEIT